MLQGASNRCLKEIISGVWLKHTKCLGGIKKLKMFLPDIITVGCNTLPWGKIMASTRVDPFTCTHIAYHTYPVHNDQQTTGWTDKQMEGTYTLLQKSTH